jgi:hypothetical protein
VLDPAHPDARGHCCEIAACGIRWTFLYDERAGCAACSTVAPPGMRCASRHEHAPPRPTLDLHILTSATVCTRAAPLCCSQVCRSCSRRTHHPACAWFGLASTCLCQPTHRVSAAVARTAHLRSSLVAPPVAPPVATPVAIPVAIPVMWCAPMCRVPATCVRVAVSRLVRVASSVWSGRASSRACADRGRRLWWQAGSLLSIEPTATRRDASCVSRLS